MSLQNLKSGLIVGGRESKEGRQTIFFTPLNPFGDNPDEEEPGDDLSEPRKVHSHSEWKILRMPLLGQFCLSTRQRMTILADKGLMPYLFSNSVPTECIYKVISQ